MTTPALGRAPATPLFTHDPTFSIWTTGDTLYEKWQCHWMGEGRSLAGLVRIDGEAHCFAGLLTGLCPALPQQSCEILPTRTIYRFADARIELTVTFCSPLLIEELDVLARPVSYLTVAAKARDGKIHRVEAYVDMGMEWPTNNPGDFVTASRTRIAGLEVMRAACDTRAGIDLVRRQPPLQLGHDGARNGNEPWRAKRHRPQRHAWHLGAHGNFARRRLRRFPARCQQWLSGDGGRLGSR